MNTTTTNVVYCKGENIDVKFSLYASMNGCIGPPTWTVFKNNSSVLSGVGEGLLYETLDTGVYRIDYSYCDYYSGSFTVDVEYAPDMPIIYPCTTGLCTDIWAPAYQWYLDGNPIAGATNYFLYPIAPGAYRVRITYSSLCEKFSDSYSWPIPSSSTTAPISIPDGFKAGNIYPNPNGGTMQIDYSLSENHRAEAVLMDIAGRRIASYPFVSNTQTKLVISEPSLPKGFYFCRILLDGNEFSVSSFVVAK